MLHTRNKRARATLADWPEPLPPHDLLYRLDDDAEQASWPELIDQTKLPAFCWAGDFEDAEEDDWPGGDICDERHDARLEDGI